MKAPTYPFANDVPVEVIPASGVADGSVLVALHGMGQSAASFVRDVAPLRPDGVTAVVPQAPYPYEMRSDAGIRQGNAWYVYTGDSEAFRASMERTGVWLLRVIDAEIARLGLDPSRVALLGFSQGGYLAGYVGIENASRFAALVVAAGRIKDEALTDAIRAAARTPLRILDIHGEEDVSVKAVAARDSATRVAALGLPVEFRGYPCGHAVLRHEPCRADVRAFLASALARDVG